MNNKPTDKENYNVKQDFKSLFDLFYSSLCLFAKSFVSDQAVAEDLVHDVFLKLWEKQNDFNDKRAIRSFLYTSVKNKCLNHLEHHQVSHKYKVFNRQDLLSRTSVNNKIIEEETHRLINQAIDSLPKQCRKILMLSIHGAKNADIARELQISINTVKTQKKLAYKQLKVKLRDIYPLVWLVSEVIF